MTQIVACCSQGLAFHSRILASIQLWLFCGRCDFWSKLRNQLVRCLWQHEFRTSLLLYHSPLWVCSDPRYVSLAILFLEPKILLLHDAGQVLEGLGVLECEWVLFSCLLLFVYARCDFPLALEGIFHPSDLILRARVLTFVWVWHQLLDRSLPLTDRPCILYLHG